MSKYVGTAGFAAPEITSNVPNAEKSPYASDVYSLGITVAYMMTKLVPSQVEIHEKSIQFSNDYSKNLKDFVYWCC